MMFDFTRSRKYTNLLLIAALVIAVSSCSNEDRLTLVEDGFSNYEIVQSEQYAEKTNSPAAELQEYIQKATGLKLPVVTRNDTENGRSKIFVGTERDPISPGRIFFRTKGKDLFIGGSTELASRYAVYEFLEQYLDCRWYSPTVEKVPERSSIIIPTLLDYAYTPEIDTRTVHASLFYDNHDFADKQKVTYEAFPYYVPEARVHTFHRFLPADDYYESNPEYYALRGDRRLPTQLCLTNDKVLELVKKSVASYFEKYPEAEVISVSQDDNTQYCTCANCRAVDEREGSPAGKMIHFVNKVAEAFPHKTISTLAYQHTRKPPKVRPADNVLITLCSIECDRSGPIEKKCQDFAADLSGWKELTSNIRIWDYTTQFTNFLAPFPNIHTLAPNIRFLRDNGARWIFEQHSRNPSELFELRAYLMAKLLWNPDADPKEIMTDFAQGYYEEGGGYILKYVDRIHEELAKHPDFFLFLYGDPSQAFDVYLKPELLAEFDSYFDQAEQAVADKEEVVQRVKTARLGIDYAILEASRKNLTKKYSMTVTELDNQERMVNETVKGRLDRFKSTCEKAAIPLMNEMGFTVAEYVNQYERTLQRAVGPSKANGKRVTLLTQPKKYANEDPQTLTDGALGGNGFYANWLGFEGNHMEAVIDLEEVQPLNQIALAFLQVTNHLVFFPEEVSFWISDDGNDYRKVDTVVCDAPLTKQSKINDVKYFETKLMGASGRYVKVVAQNMKEAPYWHHAAGLPSWIFADEVIIN